MSVLFLSKDLMFSSRVLACGRELGIKLSIVSEANQCAAQASSARLVLLDLSTSGLKPNELVPQLRRLAHPPEAIVAFGPHVHEAKLAAARDAGCDEVLARGEFNNRLVARYRELFDQLADDLAKTLRDEQFVRDFLATEKS